MTAEGSGGSWAAGQSPATLSVGDRSSPCVRELVRKRTEGGLRVALPARGCRSVLTGSVCLC